MGRPTSEGYEVFVDVMNTGEDQETGTCLVSAADDSGNSELDHINFIEVPPGDRDTGSVVLDIDWQPDAVGVDCDGDEEPDVWPE